MCTVKSVPLFLSINIQSLQSKFEQLLAEIAELESKGIQIDVIALQETWDIRHSELFCIPGFKPLILKKRRGMRGGGVGFYIKNHLNAAIIEELSPFENKIIEALTISLSYPDKSSLLLSSIYRSNGNIPNVTPTQQMERFMEKFDGLLEGIKLSNKKSVIFTDSNIDLLCLNTNDSSNYLNLIFNKSFLQCVSRASRIQNLSKSLIDHILVNYPCTDLTSGTLISDISDHFFTFIASPCRQRPKQETKTTLARDFSTHNLRKFKDDIGNANWENVLAENNVDTSYEAFWSTYLQIYNTNFPLIRQRFNKNIHKLKSFMTKGLLKSRDTKKCLHKTAVSDPTDANIQAYKNFKSIYQRVIRAAKRLYFVSKLEQNASDPKKTWQTLNEILGKAKQSETVDQINVGGMIENEPQEIANHFNRFFTSVGREISDSVPQIGLQPEEFVNYGRLVPDLELMNTTPEHVLKIIKKFTPKSSNDIHGVSTKMVKFLGPELAVPLAHIFNLSLSTGDFPSQLKKCRVVPIFKAGDHLECDNYRPISLLSSISKILEKIVAEKLLYHLTSNDLLYVHQYGFLPDRSTEQNVFQVIKYITEALNEREYCIGVFLDLRKAFDVCSHSILLRKLQKMGIRGTTYQWFKNYLSGRLQCVEINKHMSDPLNIDISVIQGSILGPILFLCYINDLYHATSLFSVLFADDTTCLARGKNLQELTEYVNVELQKVANWFRANKMAVNTAKTKFIVFRTQGKKINPEECVVLFNSNEIGHPADPSLIFPIARIHNEGEEKNFKLLGVLLDEHLSFDYHISSLCAKVSKSLFCINRIKNFVTKNALKMLYFSMVHSHFVYCINIYGCANQTTLNKLKIKQKEAIRIISGAGYRDHTKPLFKSLNILPLEELIKFSALKFMHSFTNGKLPLIFNDIWVKNAVRNPERVLRNNNNLNVPAHHFATLKRLPLFTFPRLWNEEPERKNNPNVNVYQRQLKTHLLSSLV
jgi:hypothetical protein